MDSMAAHYLRRARFVHNPQQYALLQCLNAAEGFAQVGNAPEDVIDHIRAAKIIASLTPAEITAMLKQINADFEYKHYLETKKDFNS